MTIGRRGRRKESGQLELEMPCGWGGSRKGAGRKPRPGSGVRHRARPDHKRRFPVHVTMKVVAAVGRLTRKKSFAAVKAAIEASVEREGFRITDWTVQHDHLHLMVEAENRVRLSRGMQGLATRIARQLNKALGRSGRVFADRYHMRELKTPREVRNALAYLHCNARRHGAVPDEWWDWIDPCSSAAWFDGWRWRPARKKTTGPPPVAEPRTWLRREGWRRQGLLEPDEVPGPESARARRRMPKGRDGRSAAAAFLDDAP
jgi:REP element-mobilizing transposase RayT